VPTYFHGLRRVAVEVSLIVLPVFLAIALQSPWYEHSRKADACVALARMVEELRRDREDQNDVLAEQRPDIQHAPVMESVVPQLPEPVWRSTPSRRRGGGERYPSAR
jgi:hypothetical protein